MASIIQGFYPDQAELLIIESYIDTEVASLLSAVGAIEGATTLHNKLTAARAGYLDNLIGTPTTGTFSLVNNIDEQDALVIPAGNRITDIELDMVNLAQINTIREYVQVDGANYRLISAKIFPTSFDAGTKCVTLSFTQKNSLYKVTLQASVLEGAAKDVKYRYIVRDLS